ncbi:MAG: endonuclease Q family protein [bacterium]
MRQIADFHIHSKYSRACSRDLNLENIDKTCRVKGVDIVATGDYTYPAWLEAIKNELTETKKDSGLYRHKSSSDDKIKFILSTEFALIYKKNDRCRRIHIMVLAPNISAAEKLFQSLDKNFNVRSDGRPILGMSAEKLVELCLSIHPDFLIYPAHIWTPWFSVFGSKSGFDSMEECFGKYTDKIYAYETGLSSDPEMNWRLSALDKLTLLSSSDAHSLPNIAREATVFDLEKFTYHEIFESIKKKDINKIKYTIEFYPEEGMYHYDGHRDCGICFSPAETKKKKGICPKCGRSLTVGVDYRVNELADRPVGFKPENAPGFIKLVELDKIIAEALNVKSRSSKKVKLEYDRIIKNGTEMEVLMDMNFEKLKKITMSKVAQGIERVRNGKLKVSPGFDGQYGAVKIFSYKERQDKLF